MWDDRRAWSSTWANARSAGALTTPVLSSVQVAVDPAGAYPRRAAVLELGCGTATITITAKRTHPDAVGSKRVALSAVSDVAAGRGPRRRAGSA
jgi:hypothetical protein